MSSNVLAEKDVNANVAAPVQDAQADGAKNLKSMDYHRQVLASKIAQEKTSQYISPSDNIMSPCTAKLTALRNKQVGKTKPKSLFARTSAKKLEGEAVLGAKNPSTDVSGL